MYNVGILNLTLAGIMGNLQQNCCWREKPRPTEAWPRQDLHGSTNMVQPQYVQYVHVATCVNSVGFLG